MIKELIEQELVSAMLTMGLQARRCNLHLAQIAFRLEPSFVRQISLGARLDMHRKSKARTMNVRSTTSGGHALWQLGEAGKWLREGHALATIRRDGRRRQLA